MTTRELLYIKTIADEGSMTRRRAEAVRHPAVAEPLRDEHRAAARHAVVHAHFRRLMLT